MEKVTVKLERVNPHDYSFLPREFALDASKKHVLIGRSSRRHGHSERGTPHTANAFFNSPVISRRHAELFIEHDFNFVRIRDVGSLHGTVVNGQKLDPSLATSLIKGDIISIGSAISSPDHHYTPMRFRIFYDWPYIHPLKASIVDLSSPISSPRPLSRPDTPLPAAIAHPTVSTPRTFAVPEFDSDVRSEDESNYSGEMMGDKSDEEFDIDVGDGEDSSQVDSCPSCTSSPEDPGSSMNNPLAIDEDPASTPNPFVEDGPRNSSTNVLPTVQEKPSVSNEVAQNECAHDEIDSQPRDTNQGITEKPVAQKASQIPQALSDQPKPNGVSSPCEALDFSDLEVSDSDHVFTPEASPSSDSRSSPLSSKSRKNGEKPSDSQPLKSLYNRMQKEIDHSNKLAESTPKPYMTPWHPEYCESEVRSPCLGRYASSSFPFQKNAPPLTSAYKDQSYVSQYHPLYPVTGIPMGLESNSRLSNYPARSAVDDHMFARGSDRLGRTSAARLVDGIHCFNRLGSSNNTDVNYAKDTPSNPNLSRMSIPSIICNPEMSNASKRKADQMSFEHSAEKCQEQKKTVSDSVVDQLNMIPEPTSIRPTPPSSQSDGRVLVILNLSNGVEPEIVQRECAGFGKIISCHTGPPRAASSSSCVGYVEFERFEEAMAAKKALQGNWNFALQGSGELVEAVTTTHVPPGVQVAKPTPMPLLANQAECLTAYKPTSTSNAKEQTTQTDDEEPARKRVRLSPEPAPIVAAGDLPDRTRARNLRLSAPTLKGFGVGLVVGGLGTLGALITLPESLF